MHFDTRRRSCAPRLLSQRQPRPRPRPRMRQLQPLQAWPPAPPPVAAACLVSLAPPVPPSAPEAVPAVHGEEPQPLQPLRPLQPPRPPWPLQAGAPAPARAAVIAARGCTAKRGPPRWPPGVHITRGAYGPGGPRASRGALHVSGYVPHTPSRCVPHFRLRAIRVRATRAVRPGQVTPGQATPGPGGPCRARAVRGDHVRAA